MHYWAGSFFVGSDINCYNQSRVGPGPSIALFGSGARSPAVVLKAIVLKFYQRTICYVVHRSPIAHLLNLGFNSLTK